MPSICWPRFIQEVTRNVAKNDENVDISMRVQMPKMQDEQSVGS